MGLSTDAILFYGILLEEGDLDKLREEEGGYVGRDHELLHDDTSPCHLGVHCSYNHPEYFLCVTASERLAKRGDAQNVTRTLTITNIKKQMWDRELERFCKKASLVYEQPQWFIASLRR